MVFYHTMVQLFKIKQDRKPVYLYEKISKEFQRKTRLATGNCVKETENIKSEEILRSQGHQKLEQLTSVFEISDELKMC